MTTTAATKEARQAAHNAGRQRHERHFRHPRTKNGIRLVCEVRGETYTVLAFQDGFELAIEGPHRGNRDAARTAWASIQRGLRMNGYAVAK